MLDLSVLDEIEEQHIIKRPPPPSQFRLGIKPTVDAVLLKALKKDPRDRYETIDAFYRALVEAQRICTPIIASLHIKSFQAYDS